jgi:hypothetical protein
LDQPTKKHELQLLTMVVRGERKKYPGSLLQNS